MNQYLQPTEGASGETDGRYPEIYQMVMPYIEDAIAANGGVGHLDDVGLNALADQIARESGVLYSMPQGHTRDTVRDLIKALLLSMGDDGEAVPAMGPIVPLALGLGLAGAYPYYPYYYGPYYGRPGRPGPGPGPGPGRPGPGPGGRR